MNVDIDHKMLTTELVRFKQILKCQRKCEIFYLLSLKYLKWSPNAKLSERRPSGHTTLFQLEFWLKKGCDVDNLISTSP